MQNVFVWIIIVTALLLATLGFVGCASLGSKNTLPVVKNFDVGRFLGAWHEIARLPQRYERGLVRVTATYELDGEKLKITNRGFRDDEEVVATAVGCFAGRHDEGAFRISFFRPFYGDYRILWLSPEYDQAIVSGGDHSSLWILSRTPKLPQEKLDVLVEQAARWGFDVSKLEYPE